MTATKTKKWLKSDRRKIEKAIDAGESLQHCDCCGGKLPPTEVYEELRQTGRGPDCDGSVHPRNNCCRAFAEIM